MIFAKKTSAKKTSAKKLLQKKLFYESVKLILYSCIYERI